MKSLLKTDLKRFFTHPLFWLIMLLHLIPDLWFYLNLVIDNRNHFSVSDSFFLLLLFVEAALLSILISSQHKDGIFRNKVIAGYRKPVIFLSMLLAAMLTAAALFAAYLPVILLLALNPVRNLNTAYVLTAASGILLLYLTYAALTVLLSTLTKSRIISAAVCAASVYLLFMVSVYVSFKLELPARFVNEIFESESPEDKPYERIGEDEVWYIWFPKGSGVHWNEEGLLVNKDEQLISYGGYPIDSEQSGFSYGAQPVEHIHVDESYPTGAFRALLKAADTVSFYQVLEQSCRQLQYSSRIENSVKLKAQEDQNRAERHSDLAKRLPAQCIAIVGISALGMLLFRRKELN